MGAGAAAAELPLEQCCIDACCAQNDGASVPEVCLTHEASEALSSSFALRHRAWMLGNAVSQRAARMLVPQPQNCRLSDAYRWAAGAENPAHLFRGQLGCLQRMGH